MMRKKAECAAFAALLLRVSLYNGGILGYIYGMRNFEHILMQLQIRSPELQNLRTVNLEEMLR